MVIPIGVKYREQPAGSDVKGVIEFMDLYDLSIGIVVTKDIFRKDEIEGYRILHIPIWLFLILV